MNAAQQLTPVEHLPIAAAPSGNPLMEMISEAVRAGQSIEVIRELKNLAKELAADEAKRAFETALGNAKAEIPVIVKNKLVDFKARNSEQRTTYRHEDFAEIARTVDPILAKHGLTYRHRPKQAGGMLSVTCILSGHGHTEETTLEAGNDTSGNKNSIQAVGSTGTYLQRYTLKMALGLAASGDDDAQSAEAPESITDEQRKSLIDLMDEVGFTEADDARLMKVFKIDFLADLPSEQYERAVALVKAKKP